MLFRSHKARDIMLAFLAQHYQPWHQLQPPSDDADAHKYGFPHWVDPEYDWSHYLRRDGGLSYDHGKIRIGFDCSPTTGGPHGDYAFNILRWIALQVGRRRPFTNVQRFGFSGTAPYIVYDGGEAWPVLASPEWDHAVVTDKALSWITDERGFKPLMRPWARRRASKHDPRPLYQQLERLREKIADACEPATQLRESVIAEELQRLDQLWKERQP